MASLGAYAVVVWAMTQAPIALVGALRECSILFAMLIGWRLLPRVPHDQTVIFALGDGAAQVEQLEVQWRAEGQDHEGRLVLNFPAPSTSRVARQFRLANGDYEFRVTARLRSRGGDRVEATRRVTLEGNAVTLRLEELTQ